MMYVIPFVLPPLILVAVIVMARIERWLETETRTASAEQPEQLSPVALHVDDQEVAMGQHKAA